MADTDFFSFSLRYDASGQLIDNPLAPEDREDPLLLQGKGIVGLFSKKLCSYGECALIVTGKHSAKASGALKDVEEALDSCGIRHVLFDRVEENPSTDTIMEARDLGVKENTDFVIGIGGGSPLDAAKAIALMIRNKDMDKSFLYETAEGAEALPVISVPTTCGTGSEATGVAVLTRRERRTKGSIPHKIFPKLALIDGSYLTSANRELIGNTAIDALAHLMESYLNTKSTELSRAYALQGLTLWRRNKDVISGRREAAEEDYRNLMCASVLAGMAIGITGTCLPHALSYTLTVEDNIPHGRAAGFFLSRFLKEAGDDAFMLLRTAGFFDTWELEGFYLAVCKPGSIEKSILLKAVESVAVNPAKLALAPFPADREVLLRIAGVS
ncbi:MAG: iron-containing alcohol dehydrogenase [Lachnospiraceae bacterium]|nr:iron-containing alcohol dehydrogenase [Lachnospiraceae bacterium]